MQQDSLATEHEQPHSPLQSNSSEEVSPVALRRHPHEAVQFDWRNKWLKGEEYSHMLRNIDRYCQTFGFARYPKKTHPEQIYSNPENGTIYFVQGDSIGSEFGFPRVSVKKRYRWKKMNFTTDLPKKRPEVTYIVASAVKCQRFFPNSKNEGPLYRMHAVMLFKNDSNSKQTMSQEPPEVEVGRHYVLCHIRKLDASYKAADKRRKHALGPNEIPSNVDIDAESDEKSEARESTSLLQVTPPGPQLENFFIGRTDYFRLFKHLHNMHSLAKDID